jgi:hypothetical protein
MGTPDREVFEQHQYLQIHRYHRSENNARAYVLELVRPLSPGQSDQQRAGSLFTFDYGKGPFKRSFREMVTEARRGGVVKRLRAYVFGDDAFFPSAMSLAANEGLTVEAKYAGQSATFVAPMRVNAIEDELTDDILRFRAATCEGSAFHDFVRCARSYRAYVFASMNLVEAFLNRPVLLYSSMPSKRRKVADLLSPIGFEQRLPIWVSTFCNAPLSDLTATAAWSQLQELRHERNKLLHASETQFGVQIDQLPRRLNWVREGVGGFMRKLRAMQGLPPTEFIERIETAPPVEFRARKNPP